MNTQTLKTAVILSTLSGTLLLTGCYHHYPVRHAMVKTVVYSIDSHPSYQSDKKHNKHEKHDKKHHHSYQYKNDKDYDERRDNRKHLARERYY